MDGDYLPRSLSHFVRTYNTMRKSVRLNIASGTSASASGLIRIELPQGICDLSTFRFSADLSCNVDASNGVCFPPTYMMIRRMNGLVSGVNVNSTNAHFNHLALAVRKSSVGVALDQSELECNHYWDALAPASTAGGSLTGANYRVWKYFPYTICQVGGTGMLDTNIYGKTYIEIQLESGACMLAAPVLTGGTQQSSFNYTLSDIRAFVDVVYLPNASYDTAMRSRLNGGGVIKSVCPNVVSAIQQNSGANVFNVSTGSLDKYIVAGIDSTYATAGTGNLITSASVKWSPFSTFVAEDTTGTTYTYPATDAKWSLTIGSEVFPAYSLVQNSMVGVSTTANAFGKASVYNYNKLYVGKTSGSFVAQIAENNYLANNFVVATDIALEGGASEHSSQLISGLSTQGQLALIRWDSQGFSTSNYWLLAGVCSGILSAGAGGLVSFQQ